MGRVTRIGGVFFKIRGSSPPLTSLVRFAWTMDPDGNKVELWEPMIWDDKNKSA